MTWRKLLRRTGTTVLLVGVLLLLLFWKAPGAALAASLPGNLSPAEAECASTNVPLPADTLGRTELYGARPSDASTGAAARAGPGFDVYLEGVLVEGLVGCILLDTAPGETWLLLGDLQGFGDGDYVGVWANFCPQPCVTVCMQGTMPALLVKDIVGLDPPPTPVPTATPTPTATPVPVGGIAELPDVAGTPLEAGGSSGPSVGLLAGVAAVAAGAVALGGAAWYARRR